jgi:ribosomal protein S18 acetylase RimI-like enzyme
METDKMALNITTRTMIDDDLPAVLEMVHALAAHHGDACTLTLEGLAQEAREWHRIIVAVKGAEVVGYASLLPMAQLQFGVRGMDIHHLFVAERHRRCGAGRALIDASIALSADLLCRYLTVGTHPDNSAAAQMYLAAGFDPLVNGPRFRIRLGG